jgi:uncharacterized protein YprB with RNaseH-like and TPR domain
MSKWDKKYVDLVTAVARNMGDFGVKWDQVAQELGESAKACESAWWRIDKDDHGQASTDARILKHRAKGTPYAKMVMSFPGWTIEDLKDRAKYLAGQSSNNWVDDKVVAFYDLETSDFKADVGYLLCWCIKYRGGKEVHDVIEQKELYNGTIDKRIVKSFLDELENIDLLVGFNSVRFDNTFIRTRAIYNGLEFPKYGEKMSNDLYLAIKSKLNLHRKTQKAMADLILGPDKHTKDNLNVGVWYKARLGYPEEMQYVLEHNIEDVRTLEILWEELAPYMRIYKRYL